MSEYTLPNVVCTTINVGEDKYWFAFKNKETGLWWRSDYRFYTTGNSRRVRNVRIGGWTKTLEELSSYTM